MDNLKKDISIVDIRNLPGYESLSDEEIQLIIESIKELSLIMMLINE